ncbi:hypothetical protein C5H23_00905 [Xylella fastidiosa]|nr:ESPR domain-containing protein [Xylella fastidiosa subsp. multiplex]TNV90972.1 hypothetical protein C5H23_00905 [Xylella fastidiosa]TNV98610.1 hypothetical protein C5H21_07790 [Xylella fastidiosa]
MNKDLYRLIYNCALRLWQVTSALATAPGGPDQSRHHRQPRHWKLLRRPPCPPSPGTHSPR